MFFSKKNISIRGRWYLLIFLLFFCDIIKIPLTSILIYKLSLFILYLFYFLFIFILFIHWTLVFLKFRTIKIWLSFVCLHVLKISLTDVGQVFVCQLFWNDCVLIFIPFLFKIQIILIKTLLRLDIICLRFPKAKDMFKICLIIAHFQSHDFSLSSFLKQMQNWINIKLNTILCRY